MKCSRNLSHTYRRNSTDVIQVSVTSALNERPLRVCGKEEENKTAKERRMTAQHEPGGTKRNKLCTRRSDDECITWEYAPGSINTGRKNVCHQLAESSI
jgi:hypothetical protein